MQCACIRPSQAKADARLDALCSTRHHTVHTKRRGRMQRQRPITQLALYTIGILLGALSLPAAADSPTAAADPAPAVAPAAAAPPAPVYKPKVICKSEKVTGSQIKKRTCRTEAQAAQDHRASREYLDRVQSATGVNGGTHGGRGLAGRGDRWGA